MNWRRREVLSFALPAFTLLLLIAAFLTLIYWEASHREDERVRARSAFCQELEKVKRVQRDDLSRRIRDAQEFLAENPDGVPGISPAVIRRGIDGNRETRRSLAPVDCREFARVNNIDLEGE